MPASASHLESPNPESNSLPPSTSQQALATLFAYEFLTWQPEAVEEHATRIAPYLDPQLDPHAGWIPAENLVGQQAASSWAVHAKRLSPSRWLVTVGVRVHRISDGNSPLSDSLVYLAVPVGRTAEGGWIVYDYPTLVPPPKTGTFAEPLHYGTEVPDQNDQIRSLITRFFPAYLEANLADLTYLLAPTAKIQPFQSPWAFDSISNMILSQTDGGLYALTEVALMDSVTGARYISRYTIALVAREGRWYVAEILQEGE